MKLLAFDPINTAFLKTSRFESKRGSYTSRTGELSSSWGHLFVFVMVRWISSNPFLDICQMKANTRTALAKEQKLPSLCIWSVLCHSNNRSYKLRVEEMKAGVHSIFSELLHASFFLFFFFFSNVHIKFNCLKYISSVFFAFHFLHL